MILPEVKTSAAGLFNMLYSSVESTLLITSIRLEVFDYLVTPKTAEQLAEAIETDPVSTNYLLNALVSCALLEKENGYFKNTITSRTFLLKNQPTSLGEAFLMQSGMRDMMISDLYNMVKKGPDSTPKDTSDQSEEKWGRFASAMANCARAGTAQQMAEVVSKMPEFPEFKKMLDLGGGPGIFGLAIVSSHPDMRGVIFDRKPSTKVAAKFIDEYQMQDRMEVLAGDYNQDPIGKGYDLIWASSTLNFAQQNLQPVVKKIYNALNPNGVFINLSEGLTHEATQPHFFVLCTMAWSIQNHPLRAFNQGEIAEEMIKAGFRSVRSQTVDTGWGPMDLDIARK